MCDELVMIYDTDEETEIFEMKAPVKEVSEVITLDSDSESEDYQNTGPKINEPDENELHFDDFEIDPNEKRTKLFVNHLPQELTDIEFNTLFMEDGPIKECFIFRDRLTQYSYGYGLVEFEFPDDAARALRYVPSIYYVSTFRGRESENYKFCLFSVLNKICLGTGPSM